MITRRRIVAIHKPEGTPEHHSAIEIYRWRDVNNNTYDSLRIPMANWMLQNLNENLAYVVDKAGDTVYCKVMKNQYGTYYLETRPDGIKADNLLSLPRF